MKNKYHFLTIKETTNGFIIVTLPGQVVGRTEVIPDTLVKSSGKKTLLQSIKKKASPGDILFTTTLKNAYSHYTVKDVNILGQYDETAFPGLQEAYENYLNNVKK